MGRQILFPKSPRNPPGFPRYVIRPHLHRPASPQASPPIDAVNRLSHAVKSALQNDRPKQIRREYNFALPRAHNETRVSASIVGSRLAHQPHVNIALIRTPFRVHASTGSKISLEEISMRFITPSKHPQKQLRFTSPRLLIGFALMAAISAPAVAATLCVKPGGKAGCFSTIGAAVAAASPGSTINVGPGTYEEDVVLGKSL